MSTLEIVRNSLLVLHFIGFAALFGGFLSQSRVRERKIQAGMLHGALLTFVAGIGLVGVRYPLHDQDPNAWPLPDNAKVLVKTLLIIVILILAFHNRKKLAVDSGTWLSIGLLTLANIVIAIFW